jgi:hypothetical protein
MSTGIATRLRGLSVWLFALGYFVCYVPYSALTKALSSRLVSSMDAPIAGVTLLPISNLAAAVAMLATLTALGWWKHATHSEVFGVSFPRPTRLTTLTGLATATVVVTTTLAYTFEGVSIPFVMVLMRGGVLLLAPLIDTLAKRKVRWFSWLALALSLAGLVDALARRPSGTLPLLVILDVALYLAGYFVRLRVMSSAAKSSDANRTKRYFVEEQMVATPAVVLVLGLLALVGGSPTLLAIRAGFLDLWHAPVLPYVIVIGVLSQGTGLFGTLVLLDARENTFCVPLNRASSILAGVLAAFVIHFVWDRPAPTTYELVGAGLLVSAIFVLSLGPMFGKKAAAPA